MKRKENKRLALSIETPFPVGASVRTSKHSDGPSETVVVKGYFKNCNARDVHYCRCPSKGIMMIDSKRTECIYFPRVGTNGTLRPRWELIHKRDKKKKSILKEKIKEILDSKPIPPYKRKVKEPIETKSKRYGNRCYD